MRTLKRNKQKMFYSLQGEEVPIYEMDSEGNIIYYEDSDGNRIPLETGEYEIGYSEPVEFYSNVSMSGGEAEAQEYGLSVSDYNAILVCQKGYVPITEGSLIWIESEVGYKDIDKTILEPNSADYKVIKVSKSLSFVKYILKARVK